jgi:3-oxoadipate enol-lactonase
MVTGDGGARTSGSTGPRRLTYAVRHGERGRSVVKVKVPGGQLEVRVEGSGPALLLLHAFPLNLSMWDAQAAALQDRNTVVRFDARGFGGSTPAEGLLSMEGIADDAVAALDHAGAGQAAVCGLSMGGYAAMAFARRHPSRLRALVLADTKAGADTAEARANRATQAEKVRREGTAGVIDAMLPKLLGSTTRESRPAVVEQARALMAAASPRAVVDALAGLAARADSGPHLRDVRVPTLVLCGEEDDLTPPTEAEAIARAVPAARLTLLPGAGHLANLETPEAFTAALRAFLAGSA